MQLSEEYTYEQYKYDFGKRYSSPTEEANRRAIFQDNLRTILQHNRKQTSTYRMGVNHLTDLTPAELKSMQGYHKALGQAQVTERLRKLERGELPMDHFDGRVLPMSVDWREKFIITAVKDQGQCGSCWSFGSAEAIESYWALATGELPVLSEQHILSCVGNPNDCGGTGGCGGGTAELVFSAFSGSGIASEWKYPYLSWYGNQTRCLYTEDKVGPPAAWLKGYRGLPPNNYEAVLKTLAYVGPLTVNVDASTFHLYEEGVFDGCDATKPDINHVVQLVGYGTTSDGVPFWTLRNSWTPTYGEKGYIRVLRDHPPVCGIDVQPQDGIGCNGGPTNVTVCGMCGVVYDASYPIVDLSHRS